MCKIYSVLTIKTPEQRLLQIYSKVTIKTQERFNWRLSGFFIVKFEQISSILLGIQLHFDHGCTSYFLLLNENQKKVADSQERMYMISLELPPWGHIDESDYVKFNWLPVEEKTE